VTELAAAGTTQIQVANAAGLVAGDVVRLTGPSGDPKEVNVVSSVQAVGALVVEATGAIEARARDPAAVVLKNALTYSFPKGSSVVKFAEQENHATVSVGSASTPVKVPSTNSGVDNIIDASIAASTISLRRQLLRREESTDSMED
jgi:hypothetical protein